MELKVIAKIHTEFKTKFGVPRQSGLVEGLRGTVVFEPLYRNTDALRGLEGFSHIWLLWGFSENEREDWSPTVRPPRLGGNKRMGVFATRSPFRPNAIGLSCVKIDSIENTADLGAVIHVSGADLVDGTPIYDIKPYLAFTDSRADARGGFAEKCGDHALSVYIPDRELTRFPSEKIQTLTEILAQDPRPAYQNDAGRIYGFEFDGFEIKFTVDSGNLTVTDISKTE